jgi:hypothetical protein
MALRGQCSVRIPDKALGARFDRGSQRSASLKIVGVPNSSRQSRNQGSEEAQSIVFDEGGGLSMKEQQYDPTSNINELRQRVDCPNAPPNRKIRRVVNLSVLFALIFWFGCQYNRTIRYNHGKRSHRFHSWAWWEALQHLG